MIEELKPYPKYKDSREPWLGRVPSHWPVLPSRALFSEVREREQPNAEMLSVTIQHGVVRQSLLLSETSKKDSSNQDRSAYKVVSPGDIVYNKMRAWQGALGASRFSGIVSPAYVVMRPRHGSMTSYFHALLRTSSFAKEAERWSYGITSDMWSLRPEHFRMIYATCPPADEQAAIVKYLGHVDRKINRYIRAKKQLTALLNEQKQGIIHLAVTRGLDPNVSLKPSGIEWLGDVPKHWQIRKLGSIASVFNGTTPSRMRQDYWEGGTIPWLSSGKVNDYVVSTPSELISEKAFRECSVTLVPKGSVILGLVGQGKTRGMSAILDIDACINQNLAAIVPRMHVDGRFVLHLLTAFYKNVRELGRGGNQEALNCDIASKMRLPVPPIAEQHALIKSIEARTQAIVHAQTTARREIELLTAYRSRLIADVVTGKLDVRAVASELPDITDAEPIEPVDDAEVEEDIEQPIAEAAE